MRAALDDATVVENHDRVGVLNGRKPVRDDKDRSALHQRVHALLYERLCPRIDGGCRLVQNHDGRVCDRRARDGDELALALREVGRLVPQYGVVPFGEPRYKVVRVGKLRRLDALLVRRVQLAVADVLHDGARKQVGILQHDAQRAAQIGLLDLVDVDAVVADLAVGDVVEAVDEVCDRRLARARSSHEGDLLPRLRVQADIVQDDLFGNVAEVDVEHADVPFQLSVGDGAVRLVRVLPRPLARALGALGDVAVFVDVRVDEGDVSVVLFRLFVEQFEDTARAREAHDDRVDLHGDLPDVQRELAGHVQEGRNQADHGNGRGELVSPAEDGEVAHVEHDEQTGDDRRDDEHEVPDVHDGGHQNVAVGVRLVGRVAEFVVDLVELLFRLFLVAEYLDDLLTSHHLLDVTFGLTDDLLLADKVPRAAAADRLRHERHEHDAHENDEHQPQAVEEHDDEQCDRRDAGIKYLRNAHGDELAQRVGIVGVHGHDVAVGVRIEIADGQCLHLGKHIVAHVAQESLRDDRHRLVIEEGRAQRHDVHHSHAEDDPEERAGNVCPLRAALRERGDDLGEYELQKYRRADTCRRRKSDADEYGDHSAFIVMEQIAEQPSEQFEGMHFRLCLRCNGLTHGSHLPLLRQTGCRSCSADNTLPDRSGWKRAAPRACRWRRSCRRPSR